MEFWRMTDISPRRLCLLCLISIAASIVSLIVLNEGRIDYKPMIGRHLGFEIETKRRVARFWDT